MKSIFIILFIIQFLVGCVPPAPSLHFIPYTNEEFQPTEVDKIEVFNRRLDLPKNYIQFGVIKFEGEVDRNRLKEYAAARGANAILFETNNVILIRYTREEENKDEKDSIKT
jgi:PBP1b-binding outer membrane lipoprotein LpoB